MKIENFKQLDPPIGSLVAKFDANFGAVTVRGMTVFSKDGRRWISEPAEKWTDRDGNPRWHKHAIISDQFAMADMVTQVKALMGADTLDPGTSDDCPF